ncbi:histidine--tRNA ligase [Thermoplasmatales archaeon ex4572_165]|nr:MAG: histidine--tRNA ligase [Thermoplasmatales archaeon ex4572_165]RLF59882.1 MAG: histidine--tRNA ligase [Thermoplasmata archaeon]
MIERPRGTRDFSVKEMEKRKFVEEKLRSTFQSFGFQEIQTPTFEQLDLFTMKSGESIIDELYSFTDKGGRNLALRPELTAPVIRMYVDQLQMESKPLKLFYFGNCYRYDRPQKGRYREFMQAGCELIGTNTPEALSELIAMAYHLLVKVDIKDITLDIGNLKLLTMIFKKMNINKDQQKQLFPLIDKELFSDVTEMLEDFNFENNEIKQFISFIQQSNIEEIECYLNDDEDALKEVHKMKQLIHFLDSCFEVKDFHLNLGIVRGLDYYQGVVFEIKAPKLGAEKQICGGGEYDLISLFNGRKTHTSGFALGFDRTILSMELEDVSFPSKGLDYFIVPVNDDMIDIAIQIAMRLRLKEKRVDIDLMKRGIGKAMKYAGSKNTSKVIIIGPREIENNMVTLRDMATGNQQMLSIDTLDPIEA